MTDVGTTKEVAPGVLVIRHPHVEGNTGVVVGDTGAVVIDTGPSRAHRSTIAGVLAKIDVPVVGTILTHGHWDHVLGGTFGSRVYSGADTEIVMRSRETEISRLGDIDAEELGTYLPWPTDPARGERQISIGSRTVTLMPTPGHSPDSVCVYVDDCAVLFGGDTVVTCIPPVFRDGNSAELEATLVDLSTVAPLAVIVPGHGPLVESVATAGSLAWPLEYIRSMRAGVESADPSDDIEDLVERLSYEAFVGDHFDRRLHKMDWRHRLTIESLVAEQRSI